MINYYHLIGSMLVGGMLFGMFGAMFSAFERSKTPFIIAILMGAAAGLGVYLTTV